MGRIIKTIEIEGHPATALFDTGATFTYVHPKLLEQSIRTKLDEPVRVGLGGDRVAIDEVCLAQGKIEGLSFYTDAFPYAELGKVDGHDLDVLIGVLTMERYAIRLDSKSGALDLEGLRTKEFTEY